MTAPYQGVVTQSFTVSGQISPGIGTPLTIPEGLLVEQIFVQPGDQVTEGQTLALLSLDDVRTEIEQVQASMQQHQVQANQLLAGQAADPFAWQQAQQQLDRAYADYQQAAAEGEADVSQAQNVLDAAHQVLAEVEGRKPQRPYEDGFWEMATPEQAQTEQDYADWEAEYATAQAAVQQAQADLEAAQEAADNATEAALSATQNAEDSRNSAQHNYAKETEELAKSNQTDQAGAQVLLAQIRQEDQTLKSLEALQAAGGAFFGPIRWHCNRDGTYSRSRYASSSGTAGSKRTRICGHCLLDSGTSKPVEGGRYDFGDAGTKYRNSHIGTSQ